MSANSWKKTIGINVNELSGKKNRGTIMFTAQKNEDRGEGKFQPTLLIKHKVINTHDPATQA